MIRRGGQWLIGLLVVLYAGYAALMIFLHPRVIYPFSQEAFTSPRFERFVVPVTGDEPVTVYVHEGAVQQPILLYFMGNRGALELFRPMLDHHAEAGRSVVAMAFRGGGGVPGESSEISLKRDALAVFDALPELLPGRESKIVQGYSLGTGLAVHVAARRPVNGVILSAPYDRLCRLMREGSGLPACLLPGVQKWDSAADAQDVSAPVLILHGTADKLVPYVAGSRLAGRFSDAGVPVDLVPITGAGHTNLTSFPGYYATIDAFFLR